MNSQEIKEIVKAEYGQAALQAKQGGSSCCGSVSERAAPITSNLYEVQGNRGVTGGGRIGLIRVRESHGLGPTQSWRDGFGSRVRWWD